MPPSVAPAAPRWVLLCVKKGMQMGFLPSRSFCLLGSGEVQKKGWRVPGPAGAQDRQPSFPPERTRGAFAEQGHLATAMRTEQVSTVVTDGPSGAGVLDL